MKPCLSWLAKSVECWRCGKIHPDEDAVKARWPFKYSVELVQFMEALFAP